MSAAFRFVVTFLPTVVLLTAVLSPPVASAADDAITTVMGVPRIDPRTRKGGTEIDFVPLVLAGISEDRQGRNPPTTVWSWDEDSAAPIVMRPVGDLTPVPDRAKTGKAEPKPDRAAERERERLLSAAPATLGLPMRPAPATTFPTGSVHIGADFQGTTWWLGADVPARKPMPAELTAVWTTDRAQAVAVAFTTGGTREERLITATFPSGETRMLAWSTALPEQVRRPRAQRAIWTSTAAARCRIRSEAPPVEPYITTIPDPRVGRRSLSGAEELVTNAWRWFAASEVALKDGNSAEAFDFVARGWVALKDALDPRLTPGRDQRAPFENLSTAVARLSSEVNASRTPLTIDGLVDLARRTRGEISRAFASFPAAVFMGWPPVGAVVRRPVPRIEPVAEIGAFHGLVDSVSQGDEVRARFDAAVALARTELSVEGRAAYDRLEPALTALFRAWVLFRDNDLQPVIRIRVARGDPIGLRQFLAGDPRLGLPPFFEPGGKPVRDLAAVAGSLSDQVTAARTRIRPAVAAFDAAAQLPQSAVGGGKKAAADSWRPAIERLVSAAERVVNEGRADLRWDPNARTFTAGGK